MSTTLIRIKIDADVKKQACALFKSLGLDMSEAVNLFLHQCILHEGLPFNVEIPQYSRLTREAMEEAKRISHDSNVKGYSHMVDLKNALDED